MAVCRQRERAERSESAVVEFGSLTSASWPGTGQRGRPQTVYLSRKIGAGELKALVSEETIGPLRDASFIERPFLEQFDRLIEQ